MKTWENVLPFHWAHNVIFVSTKCSRRNGLPAVPPAAAQAGYPQAETAIAAVAGPQAVRAMDRSAELGVGIMASMGSFDAEPSLVEEEDAGSCEQTSEASAGAGGSPRRGGGGPTANPAAVRTSRSPTGFSVGGSSVDEDPLRHAGSAAVSIGGGKGVVFVDCWLATDGEGQVTARSGYSDEGALLAIALLVGCDAGPPKAGRAGRPHCVRVDLQQGDSGGETKWVISFETAEEQGRWLACLQANAVPPPAPMATALPPVLMMPLAKQMRRKSLNESLAISLLAYLGVLLRIVLKDVSTASGSAILGDIGHGFFLQNVLGSMIMGYAKATTKGCSSTAGLLSTGLTTGLCGCLTTFATWMGGVNTALRGHRQSGAGFLAGGACAAYPYTGPDSEGHAEAWGGSAACALPVGTADAILISIVGCIVSLQSLRFGRHLAKSSPPVLPAATWDALHNLCTHVGETRFLMCLLLPVTLLIWVLVWRDFTQQAAEDMEMETVISTTALAVGLAPVGAVLRFRLSGQCTSDAQQFEFE